MALHRILVGSATIFMAVQLSGCSTAAGRPGVISSSGITSEVTTAAGRFDKSLYARFVASADAAYPDSAAATIDPDAQRRFMHSGFALIYSTCNRYIEGKSDRQRSVSVWRDAFAPITAVATGLVGLIDGGDTINSDYLTGLALLTSAGNAGFQIYEQRYLFGAENVNSVRRLILDALLVDAKLAMATDDLGLSYEQSVVHLIDNQMICSPGHILELVREAIDNGNVKASKVIQGDAPTANSDDGQDQQNDGISADDINALLGAGEPSVPIMSREETQDTTANPGLALDGVRIEVDGPD